MGEHARAVHAAHVGLGAPAFEIVESEAAERRQRGGEGIAEDRRAAIEEVRGRLVPGRHLGFGNGPGGLRQPVAGREIHGVEGDGPSAPQKRGATEAAPDGEVHGRVAGGVGDLGVAQRLGGRIVAVAAGVDQHHVEAGIGEIERQLQADRA